MKTAIGLAIVGVVALAVAAVWTHDNLEFDGRAWHVPGVVTSVAEDDASEVTLYAPTVEADADRHLVVEGEKQANEWQVGDHVDLLYDPREPEHVEIDAVSQRWFGTTWLLVVGGIALIVALPIAALSGK